MTVSGLKPTLANKSGHLAEEAIAALRAGDPSALIAFHRRTFGGVTMELDDDGSGGDDSNDGDDDTNDSDSGADDINDDDADDDASGGGDDTVSKADLEAALKRMKAADQRAAKAEQELKKIKDAELGDLERATKRAEELETENGSLREQLTSLKLNNAFLAANKITWHNPAAAMKLAQSEGYIADVTDDDGNVDEKALGSALTKLAKEHEYLVKPRDGAGPSGDSAGGRSGNGKDDKATVEADRRRAPALSRRR